jgi:hypothetical protein
LQEEEEPFMSFPSDSGMLKPSEIAGAGDPDAEIKKLKRDKKLEALFEDIPKVLCGLKLLVYEALSC